MLRFDKVIKPEGLLTSRVAYSLILDNHGLYLIETGRGFLPQGATAGRGITKVLSAPVIATRSKKYFLESEQVEQEINRIGYAKFPLGKRGAFLTRGEIKSVDYALNRDQSFVLKLKTTKGKFKLVFYAGLHDNSAVARLFTELTNF